MSWLFVQVTRFCLTLVGNFSNLVPPPEYCYIRRLFVLQVYSYDNTTSDGLYEYFAIKDFSSIVFL